ncbi:transposable element Tcb1 transposase [Trichonephila clavipes]|nr:transposable element Tcb1 transposase [Trichonephila clavipes]
MPDHCDIDGNEHADFLAKKGALVNQRPDPSWVLGAPGKAAVAHFRLLTGHDCQRSPLHRIGIANSPDCTLREFGQPMTSEHLVMCPVLISLNSIVEKCRCAAKGDIHWCAKIKDEVEKLAYQLNEEAERTERPIRRLSKVMYGSTCADMQVDVMGECLSSIKHVVGNCSQHRSIQTTGTAIRGFSSGRPRGTTPADDRYIVLQARRNRRQTAGEIARHTTQVTGRPISRFTVARRLHGGGLFARRPVRCVPLTPAHRRRRSLWCREHRNWRDNEWGRVLFTDESRFSLSSDSHRILI